MVKAVVDGVETNGTIAEITKAVAEGKKVSVGDRVVEHGPCIQKKKHMQKFQTPRGIDGVV